MSTTRIRTACRNLVVSSWVATCLIVAACGPESGPLGSKTVPAASVELSFGDPNDPTTLFRHFDRLMKENGFPYPEYAGSGEAYMEFVAAENPNIYTFVWHESASRSYVDDSQYVLVSWEFDGIEVRKADFLLNQGGLDPFTKKDWVTFFNWVDDILPGAFDNLEMRIAAHPAVFTNCREMTLISEELGKPIPETIDWCN